MTDIYKTSSDRLAKLAALDENNRALCRPEELREIWHCQLDARLAFDLTSEIRETRTTYAEAAATTTKPPATFGELLQRPHPPLELLTLAKDFAKTHAQSKAGVLPQEIASTLYYACIVTALVKCGQRITKLGDDQLQHGIEWGIKQSWLDETTRLLFQEGLQRLKR